MNRHLDRKTVVTMLGTAGLGLGLGLIVATAGGALVALAQEASTPALAQDDADVVVRERLRSDEMREELYAEFTTALADELGIGNSDEVDAAIRVAMMTVVDARVDEGLLTAGQAEALKTLIATSDVPLGPGHEGRFFLGRGAGEDRIIHIGDDSRVDDGEDGDGQSDRDANDDAESTEDEEDASS